MIRIVDSCKKEPGTNFLSPDDLRQVLGEPLFGKSDGYELVALENGPFDERGVIDHRRECTVPVHVGTVDFGYLAPRQALLVQKYFPFDPAGPALQRLDVQPVFADAMKAMLDVLSRQELSGLPAGTATLDAVHRQHL